MFSKEDASKTHAALGRKAGLASIVRFSKALGVLTAAGVLVSGCYGHYSYPTGAYPANYRYQTSYVTYPKGYYETRYGYNRSWIHHGYPYGGYVTQGVRY
jgi:hypothetical protein